MLMNINVAEITKSMIFLALCDFISIDNEEIYNVNPTNPNTTDNTMYNIHNTSFLFYIIYYNLIYHISLEVSTQKIKKVKPI